MIHFVYDFASLKSEIKRTTHCPQFYKLTLVTRMLKQKIIANEHTGTLLGLQNQL